MLMMKDSQTQNGLLIECRSYPENANVEHLKSAVSLVARILAAAGSEARSIHVLQAVGYVHLPHPTREFQMVLKYLPNMDSPRTLRDALMSGLPSINARLELCKQVATAAFYTHTSVLVHKSIRPEAILLFQETGNVQAPPEAQESVSRHPGSRLPDAIGIPFLIGFGLAREDTPDAFSSISRNIDWDRNIYTHPARHVPGTRYTMRTTCTHLELNYWK